MSNTFTLSNKSKSKLKDVHPDMVKIVEKALEYSEVDFGITEGLRTKQRQEELVNTGKSKTMNSRHLTGKAVDVVAYKGSEISWDVSLYCKIADAFRKACNELQIPVVWGACWDRGVLEFSKSSSEELKDYTKRRTELGKSAFIDAVHFELDKRVYP